jgi:integrase
MSELSQSEIQKLVRKRFEQALEEDEAMRANRKPLGEEELMVEWDLNSSFLSETKEQLAKSDYHNVSKPVEWLLADNGLDVNRQSESFKRLSGDRQKDFHSFRATFITALEPKVRYKMLQQIVGHSRGKDTTITYTEKYSPKQVYDEVISKLEYPGLDLSHLKKSRYVTT